MDCRGRSVRSPVALRARPFGRFAFFKGGCEDNHLFKQPFPWANPSETLGLLRTSNKEITAERYSLQGWFLITQIYWIISEAGFPLYLRRGSADKKLRDLGSLRA